MLACDGIWDVLSNEDVLDFVKRQIAQGLYPEEICENLMTKCLAPDCQVTYLIQILFIEITTIKSSFDTDGWFRW